MGLDMENNVRDENEKAVDWAELLEAGERYAPKDVKVDEKPKKKPPTREKAGKTMDGRDATVFEIVVSKEGFDGAISKLKEAEDAPYVAEIASFDTDRFSFRFNAVRDGSYVEVEVIDNVEGHGRSYHTARGAEDLYSLEFELSDGTVTRFVDGPDGGLLDD